MSDAPAPRPDLWRALDLDAVEAPVVAVVGGGGKTALVYRLAREAAAMGRRAVVTGTTRFTRVLGPHAMPPLLQVTASDAVRRLEAHWSTEEGGAAVVLASDEPQTKGRLGPLVPEIIDVIAPLVGLVAIEADGSKMRPFKAPGEHEPVIPASATHVVAVVGLDVLDKPIDDEHVHRPERVRAILEASGGAVRGADHCTAEVIASVLASTEGGRRNADERPFTVVVNKAELDVDGAGRLASALIDAGVPRVVLASLREEARPVRATITG